MKRNAFTLIELLGVISILGLIVLIAVPTVEKNIKNSKQKLYNVQISYIESGLKNWATDNLFYLPDNEDGVITLTLYQLKQGGYVEKDITNPLTDKLFPNDMLLTITRKNNGFEYIALTDTGSPNNIDTINPDAPSILLNGAPIQYVEVFDIYTDPGVTALDSEGNLIDSSNIITTISGSGSEINTTTLGSYTVKYQVIDPNNGYKASVTRTVIVNDKIKPNLVIPDNITIYQIEIHDFNTRTGASATDNYDGDLTSSIEITGNLSILPGTYYLTYKATDSSGNEATGKRTVVVKTFICGQDFIDSRDTNTYKTVQIGEQCWMAEDLRFDCSKAGKGYINVGTEDSWSGTNKCGNQDTGYTGLFYQGLVAMDGPIIERVQGLCPNGWHIPSDAEWKILEGTIDSGFGVDHTKWDEEGNRGVDAGAILKNGPFNAKLAGFRAFDGSIFNSGGFGNWWSSTQGPEYFVLYRSLESDKSGVTRGNLLITFGASIRCLLGTY